MADDVDLWEHLRDDPTLPMEVDDEDLAAARARRAADEQSIDDLLAEIEALADGDLDDDEDEDDADGEGGGGAVDPDAVLRELEADLEDEDEAEDGDDVVDDDTGPRARVIAIGRRMRARRTGAVPGDDEDDDADVDVDDDGGEDPAAAAAAVLHERMRARRIAVRREEGLRRLRRLAWGLGVVTALVVGLALAQTPFFDVDRIQVVGAGGQVSAASVRWAAGVHRGDALLTMDEHGAERSIEALPWVADADVRREWPNTVRITVTERAPVALLDSGPGLPQAVVDAEGRVLQIGGELPGGLVTVTGVPATLAEGQPLPEVARDALELALRASARLPGEIRSVSPALEAELAMGGVARFGSLDRLDEKLLSLATVLARVDMTCADVLDVKVPGTATVSRRPC
ncbi:MAG TPA: FtsQ-type POTRA domain-containing protein [Acidimicrobiales bacterium]